MFYLHGCLSIGSLTRSRVSVAAIIQLAFLSPAIHNADQTSKSPLNNSFLQTLT